MAAKTYSRHRSPKQQHSPWLIPAKFDLGEIVYHDFLIQDSQDTRCGLTVRDYGQVIGCRWSIGNCGWIYYIRWSECNSYPESAGLIDELPEEYLVSLKGTKKLVQLRVISVVELFESFMKFKAKPKRSIGTTPVLSAAVPKCLILCKFSRWIA